MLRFAAGAVVVAGLIAGSVSAAPPAKRPAAVREPVPSLTPVATQRLWTELVRRPRVPALRSAACAPLRAVFYAPTDWRRLTTKLAATPSSCAQYYISVPPHAADKTTLRPGEAAWIRELGGAFHALAEINVTGWTAWVTSTGNSWYEAGVEARRRMAAAGYDVSLGDTWALNELSSAVRQGTGNARSNMRAFLRGLHDGDGVLPTARGVVFVAGIGQGTTDLSLYQARLQDWYEDALFWEDLSRYASDWSQEVYGDVRAYAVAGTTREARRDSLNEYLRHQAALAFAAPPAGAAARAFLAATDSPLANAAWRYDAAFGWTDVPLELMQDYVSAQVYALRSAGTGRFGFPWSPKNLAGLSVADYNAHTDALLVRLAAAIADSGDSPEAACGITWCNRDLAGAAPNPAWRTFATWKPSLLAFTTPAQTLSPGTASAPLTLELRTSTGGAYSAGLPVPVTVSSTSPTGQLATDPLGPWSATVTTQIASGASTASVYYRDTAAGTATITAAAPGKLAATQPITVAAPPDTTPPETAIDSAPTGTTTSTEATIAFSSPEPGTRFECSLDSATFATCASPVVLADLAAGLHAFDVRAVDTVGNADATPARASWTIAQPAPTSPPPAPAPGGGGGGGGPSPDLAVQASVFPPAPAVGSLVTYAVSIRNLGGVASRTTLVVQLPPQVTFAASQADRGPGCTGATTLTCELDYLAGDLVANVRIQATVREPGTLTLTAHASAQPADAQPANDTASVVVTVAGAAPLLPPPLGVAPVLRAVGRTPASVKRNGTTATIMARFRISEAARIDARLTPLRSARQMPLLPGTALAGRRSSTTRPAVSATVPRAGIYGVLLRVGSRTLSRGRAYVLHLTATDASGARTRLTLRIPA